MACGTCGKSGHRSNARWRCEPCVEYLVRNTTSRERLLDFEREDLETTFVRCMRDVRSDWFVRKICSENGWTLTKAVRRRIDAGDEATRRQADRVARTVFAQSRGYPLINGSWERFASPRPEPTEARPKAPKRRRPERAGRGECVACVENEPNAAAVPCGHANLCWECAARVGERCPTCRTPCSFLKLFF